MPSPRPTSALTLAQAKELAGYLSRPDLPKIMAIRMRFLTLIEKDLDMLYGQMIEIVTTPGSEHEPRRRMLHDLLDRILPAQRETLHPPVLPPQEPQRGPTFAIRITNVNRGTKEARTKAIEVTAEKRAAHGG